MRVAVVGSREYPDLDAVRGFVRSLSKGDVVLSGGAPGVDRAAEEEAYRCGLPYEAYPAEWEKYGRAAGMMRNTTIAERCDQLVAFWDGRSRGTMDVVKKATLKGKVVTVLDANGDIVDMEFGVRCHGTP